LCYVIGLMRRCLVTKDEPMMRSRGRIAFATAAVVAVTAALSLPADARTKKKKQYRVDPTPRINTTLPGRGPSLDGVVLGRDRTCGHSTFVYDGWGVPVGPYCH
jgi:hypothetical protein